MKEKRSINLEDYESFLENPHHHDLTIKQLNQIIHMHGFNKLHRRPKRDLMDALSTIDLLVPLRSTLYGSISSFASLTPEQLNEDLKDLEWQECPVQSIETVKKLTEQKQQQQQHNHLHQEDGGYYQWPNGEDAASHNLIWRQPTKRAMASVVIDVEKTTSKRRRKDPPESGTSNIVAAPYSSLHPSWLSNVD
ncbi:PREDICTED: uncharacterized protein LOC104605054 [Nelumbo nucifera]|uniref:DUF7787 domain-containing protein n=2 Tax=Nelumbo nucifera TaxID=4432 RepID=A0A822YQK5_NELNU|nr:PREDICTED: uncharacterized protein LOC104605054 [Nelumbo nucifera]DAD33106.1 TPA_asm: hypothetical protein HUJ06_011957 [Nelumbo nucifera]